MDILLSAVLPAKLPSLRSLCLYMAAGIHNTAHKRLHNLSALRRLRWQRSRLTVWRCTVRRPLRRMGTALPSPVGWVCQNWLDLFVIMWTGPSSSAQERAPLLKHR